MIDTWDKETKDNKSNPAGSGLLYLKNVGNGPATNISFEVNVEDIKCEYNAYYTNQNTKVTTNSVLPGEKAELSIDITNSRQAPKKEDFIWDEDYRFPEIAGQYKIPNKFTVKLIMYYSDLLTNRFSQQLVFDVSFSMLYSKGEDARYHCELHLKEIGVPEKESLKLIDDRISKLN